MTKARTCLFCEQQANSAEHVWPLWVAEQFPSEKFVPLRSERLGHAPTAWPARRAELRLKYVCRTCNNGWMSKLESSAKFHLQPLLNRTPTVLDFAGQSTVAVWAVKTAMVLEAIELTSQGRYSQEERSALRKLMVIPPRTAIWLASLPDVTHFYSAKRVHLDRVIGTQFAAIVITMGLAGLALQVLTMRVPPEVDDRTRVTTSIRRGLWAQSTVRIWPAQTLAVKLPPTVDLNGEEGLDEFADRFSTVGMERTTLEQLSV